MSAVVYLDDVDEAFGEDKKFARRCQRRAGATPKQRRLVLLRRWREASLPAGVAEALRL